MTPELESLSQAQRDRLAYIELRLWFIGGIRRQHLVERFGVQTAAATRDIAMYKNLAPDNLIYDGSAKAYTLANGFSPLFPFTPDRVLAWLTQGFADGEPGDWLAGVSCVQPARLAQPALQTLASVTRAIHQQCPIGIRYESLTGTSDRVIVPYSLIDNGLRWHVRGFDRKSGEFRDFVITRIQEPEVLADQPVKPHERSNADNQWTRVVELELVPHPDQPRPEVTLLDYGMEDGVLKVSLRAVTAGYTLRQWNVDCSPDHSLRGHEHRLWLRNPLALYGVKNAILAPGYREGALS